MNMQKILRSLMIFAVGLAVFSLMFASPVGLVTAAAGVIQEPGDPVDPPDDPVIVVPDTGEDTNIFIDNWLLWVILGIVLLVLLVALLARGGAGGTHHHHE
jgi:hypothetical protein